MTAAERARCARIAAALDQGDGKAIVKAEAVAPLSREQRGLIWDMRQHVVAMTERRKQREAAEAAVTKGARVERELPPDLDFWPLADNEWAVSKRAVAPPEPG
jgi:hypothetical protein